MVVWNEKRMATGEATIDAQHQELFRMINQMHEAAAEGKGRQQAGEFLKFLDEYMHKHLSYEEGRMDRCKCPVADKNKAAHKVFLARFMELEARTRTDGMTLPLFIELQKFTGEWLSAHICAVDTQIRASLQQQ
jgi:hemerythrin